MKQLDRVTLIACDTRNYGQVIHSLKQSLSQVAPARTILFTDVDIPGLDGIEIIKIDPIKSKESYSKWILTELWKYIETDFVLISQWDAWVLNADVWTDEFYEVDYLGAAWLETDGFAVGNGGFSLRSKRLIEAAANDPVIVSYHPEDNMLSKVYRPYLEAKYGFKWGSIELADRFAFELKCPVQPTLGFHGHFHKPYQKTVVIKRTGAMGDLIMTEPVMSYFHNKGYRVVLETLPQFYNLFSFHYFKVHHSQEIDQRLLKDARYINLDMGYENTPRQLHLKSYFEICGIKDYILSNPVLTLSFDPRHTQAKLFDKYVVLHIDNRPQKARNIYGVNWEDVAAWLVHYGYHVIQIGHGEHPKVHNAIEMKNMSEGLLMRVIGGADFMIAVDSGPANIAIAMNVPLIVFAGSVDMNYIYPNLSNVMVIERTGVCRSPKCWHSVVSTEGIECVEIGNGIVKTTTKMYQGTECQEPDPIPPCVQFETKTVIEAIDKMINK